MFLIIDPPCSISYIFHVTFPKILLKADIHRNPFKEIDDAVCCYNMSCNTHIDFTSSMLTQAFKCLYMHLYLYISLWLPQYVCMCVCLVTQFQGCGWGQGCPWLSLLIISWSLRQLRRGQHMSSEEMEGLMVLSDRCLHWMTVLLGPLLSS